MVIHEKYNLLKYLDTDLKIISLDQNIIKERFIFENVAKRSVSS